jgi:hypothetical protein
MDCYKFSKLTPKEQINYIYHHCNLVDFDIINEQYRQCGVCLYYDGHIFVEVYFDGLRGDRVKNIKTYHKIQQLSYWYDRMNLSALLTKKEI